MIKLVALDLDDTLARVGKKADNKVVKKLFLIQQKGIRIIICSGKPISYLCGFARQAGLYQAILVGENGATVQYGIDLPPATFFCEKLSTDTANALHFLQAQIKQAVPSIWFQPNEIVLTPFPSSQKEHDIIEHVLEENKDIIDNLCVFHHSDSFDIMPRTVNKKNCLRRICSLLSISSKDVVAIGNGENDYPMFEFAGLSIGVNVSDRNKVDVFFNTISDAVDYLEELMDFDR